VQEATTKGIAKRKSKSDEKYKAKSRWGADPKGEQSENTNQTRRRVQELREREGGKYEDRS
jgi:hypothetical protein